jgi:hypothetical protein
LGLAKIQTWADRHEVVYSNLVLWADWAAGSIRGALQRGSAARASKNRAARLPWPQNNQQGLKIGLKSNRGSREVRNLGRPRI